MAGDAPQQFDFHTGVDVRAPSDEVLDGRQVPFGGSKVQGSSVVVVCVWKSTNESGLRDPSMA